MIIERGRKMTENQRIEFIKRMGIMDEGEEVADEDIAYSVELTDEECFRLAEMNPEKIK